MAEERVRDRKRPKMMPAPNIHYRLSLLLFGLVLPTFWSGQAMADPMLTDVYAVNSAGERVQATAYHGFIDGNDVGAKGLLDRLLNSGTDGLPSSKPKLSLPVLTTPDYGEFHVSSSGMFSTMNMIEDVNKTGSDDGIVDMVKGDAAVVADGLGWIFRGESSADSPFTAASNPDGKTIGTLVLNNSLSPLFGNVVLSLKSSNEYAVYAFAGLTDVVGFDYEMPADSNDKTQAVSHASLWTSTSPVNSPTPDPVPEPGTLSLVLMGIGMASLRRRRR